MRNINLEIKKTAVILLTILVAFAFLVPDSVSWASSSATGTINSPDGVNVRSDAGTSYGVVIAIGNGVKVDVTDSKKGTDGYTWYKISYEGKTGYIRSDLLKVSGTVSSSSGPWSAPAGSRFAADR